MIRAVRYSLVSAVVCTLPFQVWAEDAEAGKVYSDVLLESGLIWTEENIAAYLANPKEFLPGNMMAFAGLKKDEDIANVIAYVAGFAEGGSATEN